MATGRPIKDIGAVSKLPPRTLLVRTCNYVGDLRHMALSEEPDNATEPMATGQMVPRYPMPDMPTSTRSNKQQQGNNQQQQGLSSPPSPSLHLQRTWAKQELLQRSEAGSQDDATQEEDREGWERMSARSHLEPLMNAQTRHAFAAHPDKIPNSRDCFDTSVIAEVHLLPRGSVAVLHRMLDVFVEGFASVMEEVVAGAREKSRLVTAMWAYFVSVCEMHAGHKYQAQFTTAQKAFQKKIEELSAMVHQVQNTVLEKEAVGLLLQDKVQSLQQEVAHLETQNQPREVLSNEPVEEELRRVRQQVVDKSEELDTMGAKLDDLLVILKDHSKLSCQIAQFKDAAHESQAALGVEVQKTRAATAQLNETRTKLEATKANHKRAKELLLQTHHGEKTALQAKIVELENAGKLAQQELDLEKEVRGSLEKRLKEGDEHFNQMVDQNTELSITLETLQAKLKALTPDTASKFTMTDKVTIADGSKGTAQASQAQLKKFKELEDKLQRTQDKLRVSEDEKAALKAQRDESHRKHGDQQHAMQLLSDQNARMSQSISALTKDLGQKEQDLVELTEELQASYREVAEKDAKINAAELEAHKAMEQVEAMEAVLREAQQVAAERMDIINHIQTTMQDELSKRTAATVAKSERLEKELEVSLAKGTELQAEVDQLNRVFTETVEHLQAEIDEHESDTLELREQLEAMQEEVKGVQVELVEADARETDLLERLAEETDRANRMAPIKMMLNSAQRSLSDQNEYIRTLKTQLSMNGVEPVQPGADLDALLKDCTPLEDINTIQTVSEDWWARMKLQTCHPIVSPRPGTSDLTTPHPSPRPGADTAGGPFNIASPRRGLQDVSGAVASPRRSGTRAPHSATNVSAPQNLSPSRPSAMIGESGRRHRSMRLMVEPDREAPTTPTPRALQGGSTANAASQSMQRTAAVDFRPTTAPAASGHTWTLKPSQGMVIMPPGARIPEPPESGERGAGETGIGPWGGARTDRRPGTAATSVCSDASPRGRKMATLMGVQETDMDRSRAANGRRRVDFVNSISERQELRPAVVDINNAAGDAEVNFKRPPTPTHVRVPAHLGELIGKSGLFPLQTVQQADP